MTLGKTSMNKRPFGDWPAWKIQFWVVALIFTLVIAGPSWWNILRPEASATNLMIIDFYQEWASAKNLRLGIPVYTDQEVTMRMYLAAQRNPEDLEFIKVNAHPPTSVLWALPFSYLDYRTATLVWNLCSLGLLGLSLVLILRELSIEFPPAAICPVLVFALFCDPLQEQTFQGQLNLLLLFLLTGTWAAARRGHSWGAGLCLGIATATKLFPGYLLLYFLLRRQWTAVTSTLLTVIALTAVTAAIMGPSTYWVYATQVVPHVAEYRAHWYNVSLTGVWAKLLLAQSAEAQQLYRVAWVDAPLLARALGIVSGIAVTGVWAAVILGRRQRGQSDLLFALGLVAMLLASPITWPHYFLLLALPACLVWLYLPKSLGYRIGFVLMLAVFWVQPTRYWDWFFYPSHRQGTAYPIHIVTILALPTYALLAFYVWMTTLAWRVPAEETPTEQTIDSKETQSSSAAEEEVPQLV